MTAQGHATPGAEAASHDHHYEGTPADRLGPGEPSTPLWLPLVGIGLVLVTLLGYVVTRPAGKTGAELALEASPEVSGAEPNASAPPRARRLPGMPSAFAPNAPGGAMPRPAAAPPPPAPPPVMSARPRPAGSVAMPRPRPAAPAPAGH